MIAETVLASIDPRKVEIHQRYVFTIPELLHLRMDAFQFEAISNLFIVIRLFLSSIWYKLSVQ